MFRRLFAPYALLFLTLFGACGVILVSLADSAERRVFFAVVTLAGSIAGVAGTFLLSLRLARRLAAPLHELTGAVESLGAGMPVRRVFCDRPDEMDELGRAL